MFVIYLKLKYTFFNMNFETKSEYFHSNNIFRNLKTFRRNFLLSELRLHKRFQDRN